MIELFFWPTPNGYKATITLAELGLLDKVTPIDILSGEQFDPAYLNSTPIIRCLRSLITMVRAESQLRYSKVEQYCSI